VLTRNLEDSPVGECFNLMGLTGYVPYDVTPAERLFMKLSDLGIHPSMDKLALSHVPGFVFQNMIVHAGFSAFAEDQQLTAIQLVVSEYKLFTPAFGNSQSMCGDRLYHSGSHKV
jgi:hypothetical protein